MEAGHQHLRLVAGNDDVRLERLEATLDDFGAELGDVLVRREFLRVGDLPRAGARRPAMRPVDVDVVARRSAEELVDRNP